MVRRRQQTGNMTGIMFSVLAVAILPLCMVLCNLVMYQLERQRFQNVVESACLLAANEVSRIVINDPNFGHVSLSNHPPTGSATCAPDGEPLPVTGINTLVGTIRHSAIVAHQLGNTTISSLVRSDRSWLQSTIYELNSTLSATLSGVPQSDIHGEVIDPLADVTTYLTDNLPDNMQLESVTLANGWLVAGGTSTIPVPQPLASARVDDGDYYRDGTYKAFVDLPVGGNSYSFAGLGPAAAIVNADDFREADDEHICSIIRLECAVTRKDRLSMPFGLSFGPELRTVVCCQPYTQPDVATKGALVLRVSGSPVSGLKSWSDFLKPDNFQDNQVTTYTVVDGDYPVDREAHMAPSQAGLVTSTAQQFSEHLYYWLRNGRGRPRTDAILKMMAEPFDSAPNLVYVYEFADDGSISRAVYGDRFPPGVTADSQFSAVADTRVASGTAPVIVFRNNVKTLSTRAGGKHCGQPLVGYPLSASELQSYGGEEQLAMSFGKRSRHRRGLAVDIEIGGIRESTAEQDVASMRRVLGHRKI